MSIHDGYLFMNITQEDYSPGRKGVSVIVAPEDSFLSLLSLEVRLRCSSDNQLIGGGSRYWGFNRKITKSENPNRYGWFQLGFLSTSVDTDWAPASFGVISMEAGRILFYRPIDWIDVREWHNYTVLWGSGNGTFLVDGVTVATTSNVPDEEMQALFWIDVDLIQDDVWTPANMTFPFVTRGSEEVCTDEFIQIDHIGIFWDMEQFQEMDSEISELISRVQQSINTLDQKGMNTTNAKAEFEKAQGSWQKDHYRYDQAKEHLGTIIEGLGHWDEISEKFTRAQGHIYEAVQAGMDIKTMERDFGYAEDCWTKLDYNMADWYLQRILDIQIPEPTLPSILVTLGLILLYRRSKH